MELERKHLRLPLESRVFIELESSLGAMHGGSTVAICNTLDVSAEGLRVALEHELEELAYLQIGIEPPNSAEGAESAEPFFLLAQVRWCRPVEETDHTFLAGLALMPAQGSDIERWIHLITDMEN